MRVIFIVELEPSKRRVLTEKFGKTGMPIEFGNPVTASIALHGIKAEVVVINSANLTKPSFGVLLSTMRLMAPKAELVCAGQDDVQQERVVEMQ